MRSSQNWSQVSEAIEELANCLHAYSQHLKIQNDVQKTNQESENPVRTLASDASVEHRHRTVFPHARYRALDAAVRDTEEPVFFDENEHTKNGFKDRKDWYIFMRSLQLSVPIDIYRFNPGGSAVTAVAIQKVTDERSDTELLTNAAQTMEKHCSKFKEFHTCQQRRTFKEHLQNVASVLPNVADMIYKELSFDRATANHPATQERIRLIFLGEKGLLSDLRHLNPGRPNTTFYQLFAKLAAEVEKVTAADERRHGDAHLAQWISLEDMVQTVKEQLNDDVPVPSLATVRLQFVPRNKFSHAALNFTGAIHVQYKIQTRQSRSSHEDQHYCAALLKYFKHSAVELGERAAVFFMDDKAKVPIGKPGLPVSTGVRGKKTIAPVSSTFSAADHDMTRASLTPSVLLHCDVPDSTDQSFVCGQVVTCINDSVFQSSNPFRHGVMMCKAMKDSNAKFILKYSDGGTDQRNTLEQVQCSLICIFKELGLDMLVAGRCAPGNNYINPVKRIMAILNLGLQNCALERNNVRLR